MLRVAGSLKMGTVGAVELMRSLQSGSRAFRLGQALAELGRIPKTVHLLTQLRAQGVTVNDEDVERLSALGSIQFKFLGRYHFALPDVIAHARRRRLCARGQCADNLHIYNVARGQPRLNEGSRGDGGHRHRQR
jgi:hypothetical protein